MASAASKPWQVVPGQGVTVFTRHQAQTFARNLLQSETYRESLEERIKQKNLAPAIEALLWHYAFGKPVEQVQISVTQGVEDLSSLTLDELYERSRRYTAELEEARALAEAIPGDVLEGPWGKTSL